jgi:hypothetical protein
VAVIAAIARSNCGKQKTKKDLKMKPFITDWHTLHEILQVVADIIAILKGLLQVVTDIIAILKGRR